jgi:hypothetical protein
LIEIKGFDFDGSPVWDDGDEDEMELELQMQMQMRDASNRWQMADGSGRSFVSF